jgi:hypothetical protein
MRSVQRAERSAPRGPQRAPKGRGLQMPIRAWLNSVRSYYASFSFRFRIGRQGNATPPPLWGPAAQALAKSSTMLQRICTQARPADLLSAVVDTYPRSPHSGCDVMAQSVWESHREALLRRFFVPSYSGRFSCLVSLRVKLYRPRRAEMPAAYQAAFRAGFSFCLAGSLQLCRRAGWGLTRRLGHVSIYMSSTESMPVNSSSYSSYLEMDTERESHDLLLQDKKEKPEQKNNNNNRSPLPVCLSFDLSRLTWILGLTSN